MLNSDWFCYYD